MPHFYPDWFVPGVIFVAIAQVLFGLVVFKMSRLIAYVLFTLTGLQILAAYYIVTAPPYLGVGEWGGPNFGPNIAFFITFWGSVPVWICCFVAAVIQAIIYDRKEKRKRMLPDEDDAINRG